MVIQWTPDLTVGVPSIDMQHMALFDVCRRLRMASDNLVSAPPKEELVFLTDYVADHFALEERVMRECRYPGLSAHQREHAAFARTYRDLVDAFRRTEDPVLTRQLAEKTTEWLTHHIARTDKTLGKFLSTVGGPSV